jgi:hypothetical protein
MTPDQQRIAIAEACGWKRHSELTDAWCTPQQNDCPLVSDLVELPDYLTDLNAMHEARKVLTHDQQVEYSVQLGRLVTSHLPASRSAWMDYYIANATAAQHAQAFLRTLNPKHL